MKIIGINFLSDSSISFIKNGNLEFALSEERINRVKNWGGNPLKSISQCLNVHKIETNNVDHFCTHGVSSYDLNKANQSEDYLNAIKEIKSSNHSNRIKNFLINKIRFRKKIENKAYKRNKLLIEKLKKKLNSNIEIYDHHLCHAASAACFSGWKKCLVLTIDGYGDAASSKLYKFEKNSFKELKKTSILHSLGYFYGSITKYLGFKPHRHEGKVLGLAAYGNPKKAYKIMSDLISYDKKIKNFKGGFRNGFLPLFDNQYLKKILKPYKKIDIAAAAQKRLEDVVISYIKDVNQKKFKIALAGGVFANVKLNQKISELKKVEDIFVFPNMGDGGLSTGAAALSYIKHTRRCPKKINNVYLGRKFNNKEIEKKIKLFKLNYKTPSNIEKIVAEKLHQGQIISIFNGKLEFGPRSLGNRSILSRATNPEINKSLNKKLKRTEFMPFAPVTLSRFKNKMYLNCRKGKLTSKFMTITYKCKKKMEELSPAAVHIDSTARPQIVDQGINLLLYKILNEYYKISGIPNLINTSFNMHEEPIVYNPHDALRAFIQSKLDYLLIGRFLVDKIK